MTEANLHQPPSLLAVQHAVNSFAERLRCDKWDAVLPFEVACLHETSNVLEDLVFQHHDNILEFCCPVFKGMRCYFHPTKYPPPINNMKEGVSELQKDLQRLALSNGFHLIANGGGKEQRVMQCKCHRSYNPFKPETSIFRVTSLHNDGLNSRGPDGKSLSRRNKSGRPSDNESICLFRFILQWDEVGIYLKCGHGNKEHQNHPKLLEGELMFPSRLVKAAEIETLKALGNSYANCGIGRNYMFRKTGMFLSRSQIRWLYDEDDTLHKHSIDQNTAPGNLLQFFENSEDINYCILGNIVEEKNAVVVNETRIGGNSSSSTTILTGAEFSDLEVFSNSHRTAYNMTDEENLFVGVAWVTAGDLRLLKLFPSVIKVDDTCL